MPLGPEATFLGGGERLLPSPLLEPMRFVSPDFNQMRSNEWLFYSTNAAGLHEIKPVLSKVTCLLVARKAQGNSWLRKGVLV